MGCILGGLWVQRVIRTVSQAKVLPRICALNHPFHKYLLTIDCDRYFSRPQGGNTTGFPWRIPMELPLSLGKTDNKQDFRTLKIWYICVLWCEMLMRKKDKVRKGERVSVVGEAGASFGVSCWSSHVRWSEHVPQKCRLQMPLLDHGTDLKQRDV